MPLYRSIQILLLSLVFSVSLGTERSFSMAPADHYASGVLEKSPSFSDCKGILTISIEIGNSVSFPRLVPKFKKCNGHQHYSLKTEASQKALFSDFYFCPPGQLDVPFFLLYRNLLI